MWGGGQDGGDWAGMMSGAMGGMGGMGAMSAFGGDGTGNLVERVKDWQRKSPGHKRAWDTYCQVNGSQKFDPGTKDPNFLQGFLTAAEQGQIPVEMPTQEEVSEKEPLVAEIKRWQRQGQGHKEAWWKFCGQQGTKDYDPNRHEIAFLQTFLHDVKTGAIVPEEGSMMGMMGKGGKGKGKGGGKDGFEDMMMAAMFQVWLMKGKSKGKGKGGGGMDSFDGGCGGGCGGGGDGTAVGEIRYDDPEHAFTAGAMLDGTDIMGHTISIKLDPKSQDNTKLIVEGIPEGLSWQELKDHFSQIGTVAYAGIRGNSSGAAASGQGMFNPMMAMMMGKAKGKGYSPY